MRGAVFARFQGTKDLETNSIYTDILMAYEDFENGLSKTDLLNKYCDSFSRRKNISAEKLLDKILKVRAYNEVESLMYKYKMDGVFAEFVNNFTIEELLSSDVGRTVKAENSKYLVIFEGQEVANFGDDGLLVRMDNILNIYETNFS